MVFHLEFFVIVFIVFVTKVAEFCCMQVTSHALAGVEDILGRYGHNKLKVCISVTLTLGFLYTAIFLTIFLHIGCSCT
jgi:hypothetical protein